MICEYCRENDAQGFVPGPDLFGCTSCMLSNGFWWVDWPKCIAKHNVGHVELTEMELDEHMEWVEKISECARKRGVNA
jgi:hypothetical protein